jgi:hypothetical protein
MNLSLGPVGGASPGSVGTPAPTTNNNSKAPSSPPPPVTPVPSTRSGTAPDGDYHPIDVLA